MEKTIRTETFFRATTGAELAYIASRAEEASLAEEAGGSGFAGEESGEEEEDLPWEDLA